MPLSDPFDILISKNLRLTLGSAYFSLNNLKKDKTVC